MSVCRIVTVVLPGALLWIAWGAPATAAEEGQVFSVSEGQLTPVSAHDKAFREMLNSLQVR
jgi:hypothetical protein